jgi:hypothetical protein
MRASFRRVDEIYGVCQCIIQQAGVNNIQCMQSDLCLVLKSCSTLHRLGTESVFKYSTDRRTAVTANRYEPKLISPDNLNVDS